MTLWVLSISLFPSRTGKSRSALGLWRCRRPVAFQGNTFNPQPFVSPGGPRRNCFATMSHGWFGCMGRSTLMPTERATQSALCRPVEFDALGIITSSRGNRWLSASAPLPRSPKSKFLPVQWVHFSAFILIALAMLPSLLLALSLHNASHVLMPPIVTLCAFGLRTLWMGHTPQNP